MEYKYVCNNSLCNYEEYIQECNVNIKFKYKTCPICGDLLELVIDDEYEKQTTY